MTARREASSDDEPPFMPTTTAAYRGMVSAPHHLAAQAGLAVLRDGGNAIEAVVAAAAMASVVAPQACGLGGDAVWVLHHPGRAAVTIDGCGAAGRAATPDAYLRQGLSAVPRSGPRAAITVAGAVSSWQSALEVSASRWGGSLSLDRLFADAIDAADNGWPVSAHQRRATARRHQALGEAPGFATAFLAEGAPPVEGSRQRNPALGRLLGLLARRGLDDFYRGEAGRRIAADLAAVGSPLEAEDLARHRSARRRPLSTLLPGVTVVSTQPPTQGLAALMILGLHERMAAAPVGGANAAAGLAHRLIEAAKAAFRVRDGHLADPLYMEVHPTTYVNDHVLDRLAAEAARPSAAPWAATADHDGTACLVAVDGDGRLAIALQSLHGEFGSGIVLPETGLVWHNRGAAFTLAADSPRALGPGRKPAHSLAPILATFRDGRVLALGALGGDAQPQAVAAVLTRYHHHGMGLQEAVTAPRWVLGGGGGRAPVSVEDRLEPAALDALRAAGHAVSVLGPFDDRVGHVSAVLRRADGTLEGAADPRGDGTVAAF
jgi:gamma-glutamyltranspeptidase/glutathione hydrolase